jgi:hypothetical protein
MCGPPQDVADERSNQLLLQRDDIGKHARLAPDALGRVGRSVCNLGAELVPAACAPPDEGLVRDGEASGLVLDADAVSADVAGLVAEAQKLAVGMGFDVNNRK